MADLMDKMDAQSFIDDRSRALTGSVQNEQLAAQMDALKDPKLPPEQRKQILREIMKVLSPEDYAKLEAEQDVKELTI